MKKQRKKRFFYGKIAMPRRNSGAVFIKCMDKFGWWTLKESLVGNVEFYEG